MNAAGVILAGGQSKRMGRDKAHLSIAKHNFLTHSQALLATVLPRKQIFVSGRSAAQSIYDLEPALGPLGGIWSSMNALCPEFEYVVFLPVDMPYLNTTCIELLLSTLEKEIERECVIFKKHYLPMALRNTPTTLELVKHNIEQNNYALHTFISSLRTLELSVTSLVNELKNINTMQDYQAIGLS